MKKTIGKKRSLIFASFATSLLSMAPLAAAETDTQFQPVIAQNFIAQAQKNTNWKTAFATGQDEQIVFMNISPITNPKNEIGVEVHPFDQVILIVLGKANAILNGKSSIVQEGDMIFIPQGTTHNIINMDEKKELKLISFYSATDIPKGATYQKKSDQPAD